LKKKEINVGLLGLGTIGGQVAKVLNDKAEALTDRVGCPLILKKIKVLPQDMARPLARKLGMKLFTTEDNQFFDESELDIVVELIGGEHPAFEYQKKALSAGKHVVTANKEVISKHGVELFGLAQKNNVSVRYEASVGGGIPLIAPFQRDLLANRIESVSAIINGTTNYILTRMAKDGVDFAFALGRAQELGYAEADPKNDIEGIDAAYKCAILATLAFQTEVKPENVYREGISRLTSRDFKYAEELGLAIKLLAIAKQDEKNGIEARVHPVMLSQDSLLANVNGVYNGILVDGDLVGNVLFYGEGAGPLPTSSAVVADIVAAAQEVLYEVPAHPVWKLQPGKTIKSMAEVKSKYYMRITAADRPGVLAQISRVLGDNKISISSAIQKFVDPEAETAEVVIITHPAQEKAMQTALSELGSLPVVKEIGNFIRVEA
jgi:homoserine dehydrogenase